MSGQVMLVLIMLVVSGPVFALAEGDAATDAGTTARIDFISQFAGAPEQRVMFVQYEGFEPVNERSLILFETVNRAYLVDIEESCWNLPYVQGIIVNHSGNTLSTAFDSITIGDRTCRITAIRPLDVKALKAAENTDRKQ